MKNLIECKKIYTDNFQSENWIEELPWEENNIRVFKDAASKITLVAYQIFISLSRSVISGEYIDDWDGVEKNLRDIKDYISHEEAFPVSTPQDNTGRFKNELLMRYLNLDMDILYCVTLYESLLYLVKTKIDIDEHHYVLSGFFLPDRHDIPKNNIFFFFVNCLIPVCKKDYTFSYYTNNSINSTDDIGNLIYLWDIIKNLKIETLTEVLPKNEPSLGNIKLRIEDIYKIIYNKCSFLLKKMLYISGESEYSVNFKSYQIKYENISTEIFQEFWEKFEHLHLSASIRYRNLRQNLINNTASLTDLILLLKYLRENNGSLSQLNQVISYFNGVQIQLSKNKFDDYALKSIRNYLYNCRLSYSLKKKDVDYDEVMKLAQEVFDIQSDTGIRNFYPYRKVIKFIDDEIDRLFQNPNSFKFKDVISAHIVDLERYLSNFRISIDWCRLRRYYPFQLPYQECIIRYHDVEIFTPSSFTRPIKYSVLEEEYSKMNLRLSLLKNKLDLLEDKQSIQEIKESITQSERKYIEILGFFAAVMSFLFGTVNFLSESSTAKNFCSLSAVYGVVLMLFVSAVCLLTSPKAKCLKDFFKQPRLWIFFVTNLIYIFILYFILK